LLLLSSAAATRANTASKHPQKLRADLKSNQEEYRAGPPQNRPTPDDVQLEITPLNMN
jgi:hypothetical protein